MKPYRTYRVLIVAEMSGIAGRKKLSGVHKFLSEGYDWEIELIRTRADATKERLSEAARDGVDGFLSAIPHRPGMFGIYSQLGLPTVFTDFPDEQTIREFKRCVFVMDDMRDICKCAAGHILSSGLFNTYLYAEEANEARWSLERGKAFSQEMAKRDIEVVRMRTGQNSGKDDMRRILAECRKPACVLAAYDDTARDVINECRQLKIKVPDEVSVVGIGNDEDVCLMASPTISSVQPDFVDEGYRAARELQSLMMTSRQPRRRKFFCGGSLMVSRASTRHATNVAMLAHDALTFVKENALRGISARDVAKHLHVSRRLMDLRFREATGTTIQQSIIDQRLKSVCGMLQQTDMAISEIAVRCGYDDANYLKNLFKKRFGKSMRDFRRDAGENGPRASSAQARKHCGA